ncbi:35427_t:CDS:2, partial [Racocetra persica]
STIDLSTKLESASQLQQKEFNRLRQEYRQNLTTQALFSGGIVANTCSNEVIYLSLSKKLETTFSLGSWDMSAEIPSREYFTTSYLGSASGSKIFLIGGFSTNSTGRIVDYPSSLVYTFSNRNIDNTIRYRNCANWTKPFCKMTKDEPTPSNDKTSCETDKTCETCETCKICETSIKTIFL